MAYKRVNWQDYPSKATPLNAENLNKMDEGIANLDAESESLKAFGNEGKLVYVHDGALDTLEPSNLDLHVGSPIVVTEASQMTDSSKIYVYNGDWYSYNGEQWVDRGPFNEPEIVTDKELTVSDRPADGKVVGDRLETKANIDGAYDGMTVGSAEQLISTVFVQDNAPYTFRTAGGYADIGDRMQDTIIGGSVVWNQLAGSQDRTVSANGITISFDHNTGKTTVTVSDNPTGFARLAYYGTPAVSGHRCLMCVDKPLVNGAEVCIGGTTGIRGIFPAPKNQAVIETATASSSALQLYVGQSTPAGTYEYCAQIFDLTQMFGTEIADFIYYIEQANPGAGVAMFRKMFPKSYYEYNAGEIKSLTGLAAHETTGFNQWDEEWEVGKINDSTGQDQSDIDQIRSKNYIQVLPNTTYYIRFPNFTGRFYCYDNSKGFIGTAIINNSKIETPSNCYYIRFRSGSGYGATYNHDTCINLHWDGERDGEYEEYVKHSYPLDTSLTLRGMLKRNVDGEFYYDGDKYEADGTVTRKYGIVDLGTLNWGTSMNSIFYAVVSGMKVTSADADRLIGFICQQYANATSPAGGASMVDKTCFRNDGKFYIRDNAYTDASTFKSAMDGVMLVYELAEPTTEQAAPFAANQVVDDFGTEAYTFTEGAFEMPVGHESKYTNNLRAKLEMAPNSPSGDGKYLVKQENGRNEYVPYVEHDSTKANIDGNYEEMTVGNAEQLVATVTVNDQVPYTFRTAGGSADIGDRLTESIVGGTVVWNQLVQDFHFTLTKNGITATNNKDKSVTLSGTATADTAIELSTTLRFKQNHVYYVGKGSNYSIYDGYLADDMNGLCRFGHADANGFIYARILNGVTVNERIYPQVIDLTQMFGSDVADHIHVLEQANPGDGVAWFKRLFPNDYYEYNPGELKSISGLAAHETVGFNAWDEEWEKGAIDVISGVNITDPDCIRSKNYIPVLPTMTYYVFENTSLNFGNIRLCLYDADKSFITAPASIANTTITMPSNVHYVRFYSRKTSDPVTYNGGICINLSWDGERDGEYEPYIKRSYPLDSSLTLRGIPKLDINDASLYFDGDRYNPDGSVERRYGIVDLGTLTWVYSGEIGEGIFSTSNITDYLHEINVGGMCDRYQYDEAVGAVQNMTNKNDKTCAFYGYPDSSAFYVKDTSYSDASTFKSAMSGVYLVYELAEPTIEEAEPFQSPQVVDDFGTEAYTFTEGSFVMPVGHDSKYQPNLRAKLEMAPNSPDKDGTYLLTHYNGQNSYIPYVAPRGIPMNNPSEDGEYELILTMSNGTPTLEWVRIYNPNQS